MEGMDKFWDLMSTNILESAMEVMGESKGKNLSSKRNLVVE